MTYAFTQDVPIDRSFYAQLVTDLGDEIPEGLIVHLAIERPEGGLRYFDVWESEAAWDRFVDARLHPVVHRHLKQIFGDDIPADPPRVAQDVVHVWKP